MDVKVVDASALIALLFGEPEAETITELLENARLAAPVLIDCELANVCLIKCRRHPDQEAGLMAAFGWRSRLGVRTVVVDQDATLDLAKRSGLTAYDASYLWLSQHLGAELVTLDRQLAKANTAAP